MKPYDPTPEQRAAMDRAKSPGKSLFRAWHGRDSTQKQRDPEAIVPLHARPVRA